MTKILVDRDGVFKVTDADLRRAGQPFPDEEIDRLRLSERGKEVPILLRRLPRGSAGGRFEFEFLGTSPRGAKTHDDPYTVANVYVLEVMPAGGKPTRVHLGPASRPPAAAHPADATVYSAHHEVNKKLIRFTGTQMPDEPWFWEEVNAADPAPTTVTIHTDYVAAKGDFRLKIRLYGYSHLPVDPDHSVDVSWNGVPLGKAVWDGETPFVFERTLSQTSLKEGDNTLSLRATGEKTDGIDLVLLDWVEISYVRNHRLGTQGQTLVTAAPGLPLRIREANGPVTVFDPGGTAAYTAPSKGGIAEFLAPPSRPLGGREAAAPPGTYRVVREGGAYAPQRIVVSRPRDLKGPGLGADLLIVTHELFLQDAERLARARREEGLAVDVVLVGDVYDRFRDGMFHPDALRDFVLYTLKNWNPRPRYVLFVGDASWDYKNAAVGDSDYADWHWSPEWARHVPKNSSNVFGKSGLRNDRLFIPTHQYQSPWGHSASDNYFVSEAGDAGPPLAAIGRLPVGTVEEAEAEVGKILSYDKLAPGALKNALFVTNDEVGFQVQTDVLLEQARKQGYVPFRVYPKKDEKDNAENTKALLAAFDEGQAVAVFFGHGGRYVWRTGPPDLTKNHDLFTLEHLDLLKETKGMPVVVSLTCYSAPFDHPIADSIG
jgi:hypothetical protein